MRRETKLRDAIRASGLFDPEFYIRLYPEIPVNIDPLTYYIRHGLSAEHQPSADFNPKLYSAQNPDVASSGQPALIHYLYHGKAEGRRQPNREAELYGLIKDSNLFDPEFYAKYYGDVVQSSLDPVEHYMQIGIGEFRRTSVKFDNEAYLTINSDVRISGLNPFVHYLKFGKDEERALPKVKNNLEKLLKQRQRIEASGLFDIDYYMSSNHDVRSRSADPIMHYLLEGYRNNKEISPRFSLKRYVLENGISTGNDANPLLMLLSDNNAKNILAPHEIRTIGVPRSNPRFLPEVEYCRMEGDAFLSEFSYKPSGANFAESIDAVVRRLKSRKLEIKIDEQEPVVSIVVPIYGQMPYVLNCLDALSQHRSRFSVEILVSDDASPLPECTDMLSSIPWIKYFRCASNLGFLQNCNEAVARCIGRYVVLLNDDTRPVDRWLDELIGTFEVFPNAGYVGSQLINRDGTLQEAGGVYWADGTACNYGRGENYLNPRFSFARQVDWISGASIAVPRDLWSDLGGFDSDYCPAYCEDLDLAFRVRERGMQVWYQPLSRVIHYEGITHGRDESSGIKAHQVINLKKFHSKWEHKFEEFGLGARRIHAEANRQAKKSMFVVDAAIHTPDRDAGSYVASEMMSVFRSMGFHQYFLPIENFGIHQPYTEDYQRVGVEVLYAPYVRDVEEAIKWSLSYDYALVFRFAVCRAVVDHLRSMIPICRVIFSNVDLHYLRMEREASLKHDRSLEISAAQVKTLELEVMTKVDCSLVHTAVEKRLINEELPFVVDNIIEFPWIKELSVSPVPLASRNHIMFLGGFAHLPNVDAVMFFVKEVWPLLLGTLPESVKFLVVGNSPPESVKKLASDRIEITGHVTDLSPYFEAARVFVAPLRFGAGIKGKLIESMANGVPSVATGVAAEGIGISSGIHYLQADNAVDFANSVQKLFTDSELSLRIQEAGYEYVSRNFSRNRATEILEGACSLADTIWLLRQEANRVKRLRASAEESGLYQ